MLCSLFRDERFSLSLSLPSNPSSCFVQLTRYDRMALSVQHAYYPCTRERERERERETVENKRMRFGKTKRYCITTCWLIAPWNNTKIVICFHVIFFLNVNAFFCVWRNSLQIRIFRGLRTDTVTPLECNHARRAPVARVKSSDGGSRDPVEEESRSSIATERVPSTESTDADETARKYGLEAGLWRVFTDKGSDGQSKGEQAKDLLKRYGSAYLITSISFAIVSFAACYALVSAGVDVGDLLGKIGLKVTDTSERVGTVAIAYAAHKALSPVRFPPTVALTPVVARWLGKNDDSSDVGDDAN